jgi:hypothetical protein
MKVHEKIFGELVLVDYVKDTNSDQFFKRFIHLKGPHPKEHFLTALVDKLERYARSRYVAEQKGDQHAVEECDAIIADTKRNISFLRGEGDVVKG